MRAMMRNGLAVLAGLVAAGACIAGTEAAAHASLSGDAVFAAAAGGLGVGALVGGAVTSRISRTPAPAWIVAGLLGALSLMNVFSFPHPGWFVPAATILVLLGAWIAVRTSPKPESAT